MKIKEALDLPTSMFYSDNELYADLGLGLYVMVEYAEPLYDIEVYIVRESEELHRVLNDSLNKRKS